VPGYWQKGDIVLAGPVLAIAAVFVVLSSASVAADTVVVDNGAEAILFQDIPSVFAASKYEQTQSEAPSSVSIVTAEEIRKYGHRNLADILRSVRGFYTSSDRSYTYVGVRGFNRPGDYNSRILLLVDGYRTNDNVYEQAFIGNESIIDVDMIDRVEVIRGASSSLYGTNAFFAVVNVITKRGRDLKGGELSGELASFDSWKTRLSYGNRLESGQEYLLSASYYDSKGQRLYFPEYNSTNNGIAERGDDERYQNFFVKHAAGDFTLTAASVKREKGLPTGVFSTVFNDPRTRVTDPQLTFINLKYEHDLARDSQLMLRVGYNTYDYAGTYVYSGYIVVDQSHGRWLTTEALFSTRIAERHRVVAGLEEQTNSRQDQSSKDDAATVYLDDRRTSNRWAVYAQDEYRVSDRFIINLGIRHDRYEEFGGTTNPRLGLVYQTEQQTAFKLLYGQAFRAPNNYELYYNDGGITQKANPALLPETIKTYELVVEHPLRHSLRTSATLFHYRVRDLINLETDPADGLFVYRNVDSVSAVGAEVEVDGRFLPRLDGRLSYAYQQNEVASSGQALTNSPQHLVKINLSTPIIADKLVAGFETQYVSQRLTIGNAQSGSYVISNLVLTGRRWIKGVDLTFGVYNLFDKKYADPVSDAYVPLDTVQQDGRSYRFKLKLDF
jgi:iron complex outermembrane receptor protein